MGSFLTREDLRSIKDRADRAIPGPWCVAGTRRTYVIAIHGASERCSDNPVLWAEDDCLQGTKEDAEFIAHTRTDVPRLVEEVDRLRALLQKVLVWHLGESSWADIKDRCPDGELAEQIADVFSSEKT